MSATNKFYTVYNVLTKPYHDLVELHKFSPLSASPGPFVEKDEIIGIENFITPDREKIEIRFTFRSRKDHFNWIEKNKIEYDAHVEKITTFWKENEIQWDRYTSDDYYISEFEGKSFITLETLFDWQLDLVDKKLVIDHLLPLGSYRNYVGNSQFETSRNLQGARFLKERQFGVRRIGNSPRAYKDKNYPSGLMAYYFDHAIDMFIGQKHDLFVKLKKLCYDVEEVAANYIESCNYVAVIAGHKSLGETFTLHSHRLHDQNKTTFTIAARLTHDDSADAIFQCYKPYQDNDPDLPFYYRDPERILNYAKDLTPVNIPLASNTSIILFNASYCPHNVIWNDDIYLFFVYDHVTFRQGVFEKMSTHSTHHDYEEHGRDKTLLYIEV